MLPASSKERKKRYHHKSRSGCASCKQRHFKCDERKPICMRCTLSGLKCEYNIPEPRTFPSPEAPGQPASLPQELFDNNDPLEQRALAFFRERAAPSLTGFTSFTNIFWLQLIPQLSQSQGAVRHIVIALSTRYEAVKESPVHSGDMSAFLSRHYSLALQALTQPSMSSSEETLFVSCIALIAFERLQDPTGLEGRYLEHVSSGLNMLRERRERKMTTPMAEARFNMIDNLIEPMMVQIELMLSMFRQPEDIIGRSTLPAPSMPSRFADLRSARDAFFQICMWRYTFSICGNLWSSNSASFAAIRALMSQWHQSLAAYMITVSPTDTQETRRALDLREQACAMVGAMIFSVRDSSSGSYCCHPVRVDLTVPSRILIYVRIHSGHKVNLSGINNGRPAGFRASGLRLWPHAKRINGGGPDDFVTLELTSSEAIDKLFQ